MVSPVEEKDWHGAIGRSSGTLDGIKPLLLLVAVAIGVFVSYVLNQLEAGRGHRQTERAFVDGTGRAGEVDDGCDEGSSRLLYVSPGGGENEDQNNA